MAAWLGIGQDNVIAVPTHLDNSIQLAGSGSGRREALRSGKQIAAIVATMGTTDAFGIDDLQAIDALRDGWSTEFSLDYLPHIHADAVIGWAWCVFNDYDFAQNPLGFRGRTVRAAGRGAAPHSASAAGRLDRHRFPQDRLHAVHLVAGAVSRRRRFRAHRPRAARRCRTCINPASIIRACSRWKRRAAAPGPMAALANLLLFGKEGYRTLLGHAVEMAEVLREQIESHPHLTVLNGDNVGPVTLFRAYPDGIDTFNVKDRERSDPATATSCSRTTNTTAAFSSACTPKPWPATAW